MRIISNFKDYYDVVLSHGQDVSTTFIRKTKEYDNKSTEVKLLKSILYTDDLDEIVVDNSRYFNSDYNLSVNSGNILFFCGKIYPFTTIYHTIDYKQTLSYHYDFNSVDKYIIAHGNKKTREEWGKNSKLFKYFRHYFSKDKLNKLFNIKLDNNKLIKLHHELGSPYFLYNKTLTINPVLKEIEFYKTLDVYSTYQEIDMFLTGILGDSEPKIIEVSDTIKKEKHGFDKWSFKTPPKNKM